MFKRLFQSSDEGADTSKSETNHNGATQLAVAVAGFSDQYSGAGSSIAACKTVSFEQIYDNAAAKPTRGDYDILKVVEMLNSAHLSGMSTETKRASLFMALEAAGVEVEDLLQDAVVRQRALNDYEEAQQTWLSGFEAAKAGREPAHPGGIGPADQPVYVPHSKQPGRGGARPGRSPQLAETEAAGSPANHRSGHLLRSAKRRGGARQ